MTMLSGEECFGIWAPDGVAWAQWAKPVLFAQGPLVTDPETPLKVPDLPGNPETWTEAGIVVDLRGAEAVGVGLALAARGYRPVPLFNGTTGPGAVIDVDPIRSALGAGVDVLRRLTIAPDARPAFLIDANRGDPRLNAETAGYYDNRWIVLPQDFPSATFLASHGVREVVLIQRDSLNPSEDLSHVLRRWQEGGIRLRAWDLASGRTADPLTVPPPSRFRVAWYAAVALLGLRRSNVGGFGSAVAPQSTGGAGSGFYG